MKLKVKKIGGWILVLGILSLIVGLVLGFTVGTVMVKICLTSSVFLNTIGIVLLQWK